MKKNIKIIIIFLIFNIIVATNVFAAMTVEKAETVINTINNEMTQEDLERMSDITLNTYYEDLNNFANSSDYRYLDSSADITAAVKRLYDEINRRNYARPVEELIDDINNKTFAEISKLTPSEIQKYLTIFYGAENRTDINTQSLQKAIDRLLMEHKRQKNNWIITPYEINNMSNKELRSLSDQKIEDYIVQVRKLYGILDNVEQREALDRLFDEKERRSNPGSIDYEDYEPDQIGGSTKLQSIAGNVLAIIRNIGVVVSIISITIIGFKYMVGSVEQKAEYKKTMVPFAIGLIIFTTATTLISAIYNAVTNILG